MRRNNIDKCRHLRKNSTDAEQAIWRILRNRQLSGIKFRRQFSIENYILDFYCPELKLAIEADGGQHYENSNRNKDALRSSNLNNQGVTILRFSNIDILTNIEGVYLKIQQAVEKLNTPSPQSSPLKGEEEE